MAWQEPLQFSDEVEKLLAEDDDYIPEIHDEETFGGNQDLSSPTTHEVDSPISFKDHLSATASSTTAEERQAIEKLKLSLSEQDLSSILRPAKSLSHVSSRSLVRRRPCEKARREIPACASADSPDINRMKAESGAKKISLAAKTRWNSTAMRFSHQRLNELARTKRANWTEEDDKLLTSKFKECDGCWEDIAKFFDGKSALDVCDRWRKYVSPQAQMQRARRARQQELDEERRVAEEARIMAKVHRKKKQVQDLKSKEEKDAWHHKCDRFLNSANAALQRAKSETQKAVDRDAGQIKDTYKQEVENFYNEQNIETPKGSSMPTLKAEADQMQHLLKQKLKRRESTGLAPAKTPADTAPHAHAHGRQHRKHAAVLAAEADDPAAAAAAAHAAIAAAGQGLANNSTRQKLWLQPKLIGGCAPVHQRNQPVSLAPTGGNLLRSTSQVVLTRDPKQNPSGSSVQMSVTSFSSSELPKINPKQQNFESRKLGYLQKYTS